jgi:hypothetical protein
MTQSIDRIIGFYTTEWLGRARPHASESSRPVFIVGMPRSGTTLAEQILAAHPEVLGAGELSSWLSASAKFISSVRTETDQSILEKLAGDYLRLLEAQSASASRVVDKLPTNFLSLGLIHAAFPNARILHMCRNPIDTCLSIYFQDFHNAHAYASDLANLAHYYREYRRLMNHWRATLPAGVLLDVPYEKLTTDPEGWGRRMLEFLGLRWDPQCLDFRHSSRSILTFSKWQARQKIHNASVERWRNYQQFIEPLLTLRDSECTGNHQ